VPRCPGPDRGTVWDHAQLARVLLERALDAEVPAAWVTADEVDGGDPALRVWLEDRGVSHVLAVKGSEPLPPATPGSATAAQLATAVPVEQWVAGSAGHGAKAAGCTTGPASSWPRRRLPGTARWLLGRRRRRDGELAFYACSGLVDTSLVGLVRVAGVRWRVEMVFS
jgi:hypothetical protein